MILEEKDSITQDLKDSQKIWLRKEVNEKLETEISEIEKRV